MAALRHYTAILGFLMLLVSPVLGLAEQTLSVRVDPAYYYAESPARGSATQWSERVLTELKNAGVQTVFFQAYSSQYGAFYPTTYPLTAVEKGLGKEDVLGKFVATARSHGMRVVAMLPVNDFESVWKAKASWRSKSPQGQDLKFLSSASSDYRSWYRGFVKDLLAHYPALDGVEAMEPQIDPSWKNEADFHPEMKAQFAKQHPGVEFTGSVWRRFVAQSLTGLLAEMFEQAHLLGRKAYVVQTWAAAKDGSLLSSEAIRDGSGFDFAAMQSLPKTQRPDQVQVELIWQQWAAEYGQKGVFTAQWTARAMDELQKTYRGPVEWVAHLESTPFKNASKSGERTIASVGADFEQSLTLAWARKRSVDLYSYHLLKEQGLLGVLKSRVEP